MPFIIYESVIIRIFGDTLFALQLFNVLFCAGTALFLSYCGNGFGEECGRIASTFYALYIPNIFMSSVLTPESLAMFYFILLATYFYIKD